MMMWGRKKTNAIPNPPTSSLLSRSSSISRVFPVSWLSRFKNVKGSSEPEVANTKRREKKNSESLSEPTRTSQNEGQFCSGDYDDDQSYWRLSFGKERSEGGMKSVLYNSDDELHFPQVSCRKVAGRKENQKYKNAVSDRRKMREFEVLQVNDEVELKRRRRKGLKERKLRKEYRRVWEDESDRGKVEMGSTKSVEKDVFEIEPVSFDNSRRQRSIIRTIGEDFVFEQQRNSFSEDDSSPNWQKQKSLRKSLHISTERRRRRRKQGRTAKACSPRTIECKIKALEDIKRARMKLKEREGKNTICFAIVKSSFDPQQDFRDSMIEMIIENNIRRPEELEELLACYLTLNCDEYHDLIVKVFRHVWFQLNQLYFDPDL